MADTMHNVPRTTMRTRMQAGPNAAAGAPGGAAPAQPTPQDRRRFRAAVAARLLAIAPDTAAVVEWADLDAAPAWLAASDNDFATLQRRLGALVHAGDIRLWIDKGRLSAARSALGEAFFNALLGQRDLDMLAGGAAAATRIETADQVRPGLQAAGSIVLLACLPNGGLRRALTAALDPTAVASGPNAVLNAELANSLLARAMTLGVHTQAHGNVAPTQAGRNR